MNRRAKTLNQWELRLVEHLKSKIFPKETKIYLFGSRARGDHNRASDIDIAFENLPEGYKLNRLNEEIEDLNIPYTVDLIDLSHTSKDFYDKCLSESISIFDII